MMPFDSGDLSAAARMRYSEAALYHVSTDLSSMTGVLVMSR